MKTKISESKKLVKEKKLEFSPMISEFLFFDETSEKEEKRNYLHLKVQIRELIKNSFDRKVLVEVLLDLRKDLSGQSQEVLLNLYLDLGLQDNAYACLSSRKWQIISKGIKELTDMHVVDAYGTISKFINHRNGTVRKQAEIAVVNLKEEGIIYFLDNTKYKISEWQQLKILDILRHKKNYNPPKFSLWLTSTNGHVVLFALRMIKFYKQNDAIKSITTLLKHKKKVIKIEAIDCIKEFYMTDALDTLKLTYWKSGIDVKIAILDAIGEIGDSNDLEFLELLKKKEKNYNIKSKVLGMFNKIAPESYLPTKNIEDLGFYEKSADNELDKADELNELVECKEHTIKEDESLEQMSNESIKENNSNTEAEIIAEQETNKIIGENINEDTIDISFLPKVIDLEAEKLTSKEKEKSESKIDEQESHKINKETVDLSFLPKVVSNEDIHEVDVIVNDANEELGESVSGQITIPDSSFKVNEDAKIENVETNEEPASIEILFELNDLEFKQLNITEPSSDSTNSVINSELNEIDWSIFTNESNISPKLDSTPLEISDHTNNDDYEILLDNEPISFSANFLKDSELETMVLLEDIADMGDVRELPLLHQLLEEETSTLILERIEELISKFERSIKDDIDYADNEEPKAKNLDSVFSSLLNLSDGDTMIFLIKEMAKVGGEKEISLLKTILIDEDKKIAKLAQDSLDSISKRIKENRAYELENKDILKIDFEPSFGLNGSNQTELLSTQEGNTLFDHLCSFSNNIYNKLNG